MAVSNKKAAGAAPGDAAAPGSAGSPARFKVGFNVIVSILLVGGIAAVLQAFAFHSGAQWRMTSSGVADLSDGTRSLLDSLEADVRITSLYFQTDLEDEEQPRYRQAAEDLLALYQAGNRSRIDVGYVNPLDKNRKKFSDMIERLLGKKKFAEQIAKHKELIAAFEDDLSERMNMLVRQELAMLGGMTDTLGDGQLPAQLAAVQRALDQLDRKLQLTTKQVAALGAAETPQYGAALSRIRSVYGDFKQLLEQVVAFGETELQRSPDLPEDQSQYLTGLGDRFAPLITALDEQIEAGKDIEPLEFDALMRELDPQANPILVETADEAMVVGFRKVWPALDQNRSGRAAGFADRAFKGEEKLTSAILRLTHKDQTAVVFIRYGGPPLLIGGFIPSMPPAAMGRIKEQLEDANFLVHEWDLKTTNDPPKIDPPPARTIYVVMKPTAPKPGQFGMPSQDPPFNDKHRKLVLDVLGENPRAMFLADWDRGRPMGQMTLPGVYDYGDYLADTWGVTVDINTLIVRAVKVAVGEYRLAALAVDEVERPDPDSDIVRGPMASRVFLPLCVPLTLKTPAPDGVTAEVLLVAPAEDGLWGAKGATNVFAYIKQNNNRAPVSKIDGDLEGPFDVAVTASKGDGKIVVVGSAGFVFDEIAFAAELVQSASGFTIRSRNPGNVTLLINSLHWLNDNTAFMNIGQPIDSEVLEIDNPSMITMVKVLTVVVWPALALCGGGVVWWIRRK